MKSVAIKCLSLLLVILPVLASSQGHRFKSGDVLPELLIAPVFNNGQVSHDTLNAASLKGKKILLTFNRYVSCPLCNFRTHELLEVYDTLRSHGLILISVYESTRQTLIDYTSQEEIPFMMLADPEEKLYKLFKIQKSWLRSFTGLFRDYSRKHKAGKKLFKGSYERDGHLNRIGADFLIDENGIIQVAYYGKFVGDHLPVNEIVKWVLNN